MAEQRRKAGPSLDRPVYFALLLFSGAALTLWALGLILWPFAVPIAWALCMLTVTGGFYQRLAKKTGRPRLSALAMTLATAVVLMLPIALVGTAVAKEAAALARRAATAAGEASAEGEAPAEGEGARPPAEGERPADGEPPAETPASAKGAQDAWDRFFAEHPKLDEIRQKVDGLLARVGTDTRRLRDAAIQSLSGPFAGGAVAIARDLFLALFGFVVMLATLYFLYRDGGKIRALVVDVLPLQPEATGRILDILRTTVFAALVGGLLTAMLQGALGGVALAITGVRAAVLWGVVMAFLSLLPFGGAAFVWLPIAIYFLVTGRAWQGWFLIGWGTVVVGLADNLFRPWIMRRTGAGDIHPLLLFFAILSGIAIFGFSGIVFGPLLVAVVLGLVRIYREHFGRGIVPDEEPPAATSRGAS
jgi:predicted PurR-regulated permease PerM